MEPAGAESKIDIFPRSRQFHVTELFGGWAEEVRTFREEEVTPFLDEARADFPNLLLRSDTILEEYTDPEGIALALADITKLLTTLGGDLISGAAEELRLFQNDLELVRVFLRNAASYKAGDEELEAFRKLDWQIKLVVPDAQDCIEACVPEADMIDLYRRRRDLPAVSSLAEMVRTLREDKVKPMLEKARVDLAKMLVNGDGSETAVEEEEEAHGIKVNKARSSDEDRSVGIEDDEATIIGYLKHETDELDFISIIGVPGMGKTTLARRVYQSQEIQHEFPTRIWVTVSFLLDRKNVLLNILKEVTSRDLSSMREDELVVAARHFLEKRKFLLVVDDLWRPRNLDEIREALPKGNRSSKVLLTSRYEEVGTHAMLSIGPHVMRYLREDESWELLQLQVFGGLHICPPELVEIGQHIARNTGGLALKVVIIGGVLLDELSKTQSISALGKAWNEVFQYTKVHMDDYLGYSSWAIELSCKGLPNELRNLFLYLAVFPEDYVIPTATLTRLWIAEGFIQHQEGRSLEDLAEENLMHLIQRKLVIVDKVRSNGKVKSCHLHDSVRDFCEREGMEVNLFRYLPSSFRSDTSPKQKNRRLSIGFDLLKFFSSKYYFPTVRSFLCYYKTESLVLPENTSKIPGHAFELLRVLDIKHVRFTRFPLELTHLFCLRYIVLSSDFKILPEAISMLRNIQTLIIYTSSRTLEIKADIWKMIQLRHLQTNASIILRKEPENHSDQELQMLTNLSPENCTSNVFDRARTLKKLGIRGTLSKLLAGETGSRNFDNLERLNNLENLKLLNDVHMVSPSEGRLPCLPPPEKFPSKLKSLTLSATLLSWEHMSVLGMLEKLEILKLKDNAFVGECWEVADDSFPSLQVLQIGYTNLVSWKTKSSHFHKLRSLALRNCEKLEALPQGLGNILSLQEIELLRPTKAIAAQARKIDGERRQMEGNFKIKLSIIFAGDE